MFRSPFFGRAGAPPRARRARPGPRPQRDGDHRRQDARGPRRKGRGFVFTGDETLKRAVCPVPNDRALASALRKRRAWLALAGFAGILTPAWLGLATFRRKIDVFGTPDGSRKGLDDARRDPDGAGAVTAVRRI